MKVIAAGAALLLLVLSANQSSANDPFVHNWHSGPINCYECDSLAECSASSGTLRKCLDNDAQSCVAIFDSDGAVVQRGCSDNLVTSCSADQDKCYQCRSNGCNSLQTDSELVDCVYCDAQSDDNCVFDIELVKNRRRCNQQCITALYPTTSDAKAPLELVRTCLDDLDYDDREACAEGAFPNCVACTGASCNQVELGVRGSCNTCRGDCSNPQPQTCRAVPADDDVEHCFIEFDESGTRTAQGCLTQFNVSDVQLLEESKRLWYCSGADNCNVATALPTPQSCKLCSSHTDADCAVDPDQVESVAECENAVNTDCYARILDNGHTERGCLASLEGEEYLDCLREGNTTQCAKCSGENCNLKLQPTERLSCQTCDSSKDAECEALPASAALCLLHTDSQQCVTSLDPAGNTQRGCSASLECDSKKPQKCQLCSGPDCNKVNLKRLEDGDPGPWQQELPLSCQTCLDTAACAASTIEEKSCATEAEYCMTIFDATGVVSARGCSQVLEESFSVYCDANGGSCHNCNSNGCNKARSLDSYRECIYCDAENADCARNPAAVVARRSCNGQCMTALRARSSQNTIYDTVRGCLDDKDEADQQRCINGEDSDCVACDTADCNVAQLVEESLSCYQCVSSDDCADPSATQCSQYDPEEQCYILFDQDNGDITSMGCVSDQEETFVDDNFYSLLLCNETNCNFFDNLPTATRCLSCDSSEDANCAVDPSKVTQIGTCGVLPYTSCMKRVTNGITQRGCVSSLPRQQLTACLAGNGTCEVCEGDLCNTAIYPADRRQCQRCDSVTDPSCSSAPNAASVCPFYLVDEGCSAKLVNGETYRGCQREFTCDDSDKQHCRLCAGKDNCNVVDLESSYIGYPGKWATPPVNCYTCNGTECQGTSLGSLKKCVDNVAQNCDTVFDSAGLVVHRGCTDELYADADLTQYCDEQPGRCKFCKSTACNDARQLDTYVDCLLCDGADQAECVRNVSDVTRSISCQGSCFTGLYPRSSAANAILDLARGCLDDLEYDDRLACTGGTLDHCVACSGANCNNPDVPADRLSCNFCVGTDCADTVSQQCLGYRAADQCYIHVGDLSIENMGCASDLEDAFLLANRRDLLLCSGDNCNTKDKLNTVGVSCNICNSTGDAGCVAGDAPVAAAVCQHYINPECYSHINEDGVLNRGCLMDTDDELFDECSSGNSSSCQICGTNGCNSEVYPTDWLQCLRCDSSSDANCATAPAGYGSYCRTYDKDDACVTSLAKGRTRRGCQSEIRCEESQAGSCRICAEANCNDVDLQSGYVGEPGKWQDLPLSCHVCNDTASCAAVGAAPTQCQGNNKQTCATVFNAQGQVAARGCSDSVLSANADYCDLNRDSCPQCKSDGCNNALSLDSYVDCYFCDADEDSSCAWETPTSTRKCQGQCMTGLYPRSSAADSALLPIRGCLDDLNEAERTTCAAGSHDNCKSCAGARCNGGDIIANPQECYICGDSYCEDPITTKCLAYRPDDQCYLAFNSGDVVAMGCASDFETQVIQELVAQKLMFLCSGSNCNFYDIIPDPNSCLQCNSLVDPRCATNPNQLLDTDVCADQPYTECVTHIDSQGTTVRGCLSSLGSDDFYGCLTGTHGGLCATCTGTNCNGLSVFPADRRSCYQCDSASDPSCASSPGSSSSSTVCPVYADGDTCVTALLDGVTHRGCSSSVSCTDPSDSRTCRICSGANGCNTIDLELINQDGFPGTWQEVPISCLACADATECAATSGGSLETCTSYDNCVTVFDASGAVTERGCSEKVFEASTYCEEQPAKCPRCNSNGCNVASSQDSYVECLVCDSSQNSTCLAAPASIGRTRQCHESCVSAFLPLFGETTDPSYALVRNCYDDLEKEDRDACKTGNKQFCATCDGEKCNTEDLVASRQSCLVCQGDGCQEPQSATCANYRENDQCYIQFDEQRSIIALGCLSEFSHADIYQLQRAKRLLTCSEQDCNSIESLPEAHTCALCSSRTDASCAIAPGSVTSATSCELAGLPECYSRVLADGSTERGCLSSLEEDEFLSCYNGTSTSCSSCQGDACNTAVYPADRRSCHVCNSETDANCASAPSSLTVCYLYEAEDQCVTNLRNGVTYRACSTSLSCEADSKSCVYCDGDGCNQVDLAAKADDNHGKWQDLPLSCLSCEEAACQQATIPSVKCQGNNEQDCLTVFGADGVVTQRGCHDAVEANASVATYCAASAASCPSCKSNNCNNATTLSQYQTCIYCDSFKDASCLWEPLSAGHRTRQCQGGCMSALYGSSDSGLDLIRTCLDDKEETDRLSCSAGGDSACAACSEDSCNVQTLPEDRLSCYTCTGDDCEDPSPKLCAIYKSNDSCFLWMDEDNSIQQLGCLSSFRNQDLESVIKTKRIAVCEGANCNAPQLPVPVQCAVCDSREDPTCATNAQAIGSFDTCSQLPHTGCATRLLSDGSTSRGCLYDLSQSDFAACLLGSDANCSVCSTDGCNREVFPADRQVCYTCTSEDDSYCESNPTYALACAWVSDAETCKTSLTNGNVTTRGCSSSSSISGLDCDLSDFRNCRSCVGSECNAIDLANRQDDGQHGYYQELPLKCHTCAGEHCISSLGPAVTCNLNIEQDCKTVFEADGVTVRRRGCSDDVDDYEDRYCRHNPELCPICKSNECNDAWNTDEFVSCVYCNSETNATCITDPTESDLARRQCKGQCLVALHGEHLIRSCLDDKELYDRVDCSSDESGTNCAVCAAESCNTFAYPADRLSCHICVDAACTSSRAEFCVLYDTKDYCFAKYNAGAVELMGCASSQNSTSLEEWQEANQLWTCTGKECNDLNRLPEDDECVSCDSSKTLACAQDPEAVNTTLTCHAPNSKCVARLENGHTIRGCQSALSNTEGAACEANGSCSVCSGNKCNTGIFPASRRRCHICNSAAQLDCSVDPNYLAVCPIYDAADSCVSAKDFDGYLIRGCASEVQCVITNDDYCEVCQTDGCNTANLPGAAGHLSGMGLGLTLIFVWAISMLR